MRSFRGWPKISQANPNTSHHSISSLQKRYRNLKLITQNVDGLHLKSGTRNVLELRGSLSRVKCIYCHEIGLGLLFS